MIATIFFILLCTTTIFYLLSKDHKKKEKQISIEAEDTEENINLTQEDLRKQEALSSAYKMRLDRYASLEHILNKFNSTLSLTDIAEYLVEEIFKLVGQSDGNVIFYFLNRPKQKLEILRSYRESCDLVIKAKEGDIFDQWVLKQAKPLLVADTKTDFRFDAERIHNELTRNITSLIASPIISEDNFLGILRIDRSSKRVFNTEDLRLLSTISDVAAIAVQNALLYKRTEELAIIDSLTCLYQRTHFLNKLNQEALHARNESKVIAVIMVDIDYFKNYNDEFGHTAGDIVLKRIASILKASTEGNEALCCRFGGEEFILYLSDSSKEDAKKVAENIRRRIQEEIIILRKQKTSMTASIGVACFPDDASTVEDLIRIVDQRMYSAKAKGRNQICFT